MPAANQRRGYCFCSSCFPHKYYGPLPLCDRIRDCSAQRAQYHPPGLFGGYPDCFYPTDVDFDAAPLYPQICVLLGKPRQPGVDHHGQLAPVAAMADSVHTALAAVVHCHTLMESILQLGVEPGLVEALQQQLQVHWEAAQAAAMAAAQLVTQLEVQAVPGQLLALATQGMTQEVAAVAAADAAGRLVITEMQLGRLGAAAAAVAAAAAAAGNQQAPLPGSAVNSALRALRAALEQQGDDRDMDMDGGEESDSEMEDADPAAAAQAAAARRLPGGPDDGGKRRRIYSTASTTFTPPDADSSMSEEEVRNLLQQLLMELLHFKAVFALPFRAIEMLYDILCHWRGVKKELRINMPNNYPAHLTMLERHLGIRLPMEILYHMCRMCGNVFRLETKGAAACICGHPRHWPGTNRPQQVFVYRSLRDFMEQVFANPFLAPLMTYHSKPEARLGRPQGEWVDFYDGDAYKEARREGSRFAEEPRHLMLSLVGDGFQVYKGHSWVCR